MPDGSESLNVLVLGATGRVGQLLKSGFEQMADSSLHLWYQTRHKDDRYGPEWVFWNHKSNKVVSSQLRSHIGQINAVFCLSGITPATFDGSMAENTNLALAAWDLAVELGADHLFLASSAAVYGVPTDALPLSENSAPNPVSEYGRAKLVMEQALLAKSSTSEVGLTCLRIGNVAGADQLITNALKNDQNLVLDQFADGCTPQRSYIGPGTLAAMFNSLGRAVKTTEIPSILNVAAPGLVSMQDLLAELSKTGNAAPWQVRKAPSGAIPTVQLDTTKLEKLHQFDAVDSTAAEMIRQVLMCRKTQ